MKLTQIKLGQLLLLLSLVSACAVSWNDKIQLAQSLEAEKKYPEAIAVYQQALNKYPDHHNAAQVYLAIGDIYYIALQQPNEALSSYQTLIKKFPRSPITPAVRIKQAQILEETGNYPRAISAYAEIIQSYPKLAQLAEFRFKIGHLHHLRGDLLQARFEIEQFLKDHPKSTMSEAAFFELGEIYFKEKKYKNALIQYQRLSTDYPHSHYAPQARYNSALCYEQLRQWPRAYKVFQELLETHPNPAMIKQHIDEIDQRKRSR